ncbi:tRNA uridine(34) 5-carboxymethylaminomethyl modification radical SAM/GNAT enzyme Elp3 [Patescibacteria group bacterium]|nr:tRNA uridine(34) 5-carboxymethylaminomethyl modification radical SAM/GNAT enzyme Elp3 [Patescibacteria group bacterium]
MASRQEQFILEALKLDHITLENFEKLKKQVAKESARPCFSNIELLKAYRHLIDQKKIKDHQEIFYLLKKQKTRTISGIASIAVLTKPWPCPGKCLYCPDEQGMPKSYFSDEPAVMRAILNDFDPARQVRTRIQALQMTGHETNKIELIVMGGTFSSLPKQYQTSFIKRCFMGANAPSAGAALMRPLRTVFKRNETAKNRIIGLTLETRPDYITPAEVKRFRELGATRVELGVQSIYDDVLKKNNRGHLVKSTITATKLLKDAGFKINYHLMPNMYGSDAKRDLEMFEEIFSNPDYQPDLIKIYPCVVTRDSELQKLYKQKKFVPYSDQQLINLIIKIKQIIPPYVRIMRLGRDIPAPDIIGGNKLSNIRQIVQAKLKDTNTSCQCIRCREVRNENIEAKNVKLVRRDYKASDGQEVFLSYEDTKKNKILALLRLRKPSSDVFLKPLKDSAIIREVHTYGEALNFSDRKKKASQHLGFGKKLLKEAERITAKEFGLKKVAVISGIGARGYYRKNGYRLQDTYMVKRITSKKS